MLGIFSKTDSSKEEIISLQRLVENLKDENHELKRVFDEYREEEALRLWHMQYSYDRKISQLALDNIERLNREYFRSTETGDMGRHNSAKLHALKDMYKNKRCFIIGNGPSLLASDLQRLRNEITFAVNKITEIFKDTDWRPTYYLVSDPLYFKAQQGRLNELQETSNILMDSEIINSIEHTYCQNAMYYYNIRRYSIIPEFSLQPDQFVHEGGSVLYHAVQFAVFMGIKEVYLLGVDNNFRKKTLPDGRKVLDFLQSNQHIFINLAMRNVK